MTKKTAVLVSGGVDSSLALQLMHEQGYPITAYYLKIWLEDELSFLGDCPWEEDLSYITPLCERLGIPLEIVPLQKEYWERVVSYTIAEIKQGRTPNPDMLCNPHIKFGVFYDQLKDDCDQIATGHYAQKVDVGGHVLLAKAKDSFKDQTYFLANISQAQLQLATFPIGHLAKSEVREQAISYNLPAMARKDSQGICFLGKLSFNDFIKYHVGTQPGPIIEFETGTILGTHEGFWFHTIGQRRGLKLSGGPWYVVAKKPEKNIVFVSRNYFDETKARNSFVVSNFNWIYQASTKEMLQVKVRHGEQIYTCRLEMLDADRAMVTLDERDQGIAPGQFAVFYDDNICLGCAVIVE